MNTDKSFMMHLKIDAELDKEVRRLCKEIIRCWSLGHIGMLQTKKDKDELHNLLYLYIKRSDLVTELHAEREAVLIRQEIMKLTQKIMKENRKNNS
jgi:hypothetical protein